MPASQLILCHHCKKHTAVKICSKCADCRLLCAMCSASIHEKQNTSHHKPRQVCTDCFNAAANVSCHDCESSLCRACVLEHSRVCQPDTDSECARFLTSTDNLADTAPEEPLIEEDLIDVEDSASDSEDDLPLAVKPQPSVGNKRPRFSDDPNVKAEPNKEAKAPKPKPNRPKKPTVKKVAEVVGQKDIFERTAAQVSSTATQKVSEEVLSKIQKALALGLHSGGHEAEKTHAMKRATRLMQQYGLSQAEVGKVGKSDVEAVAGVVAVRLNGLFQRWPMWGHTLMAIANLMANTKGYFNRARKGSSNLEDSMTVSFYGLKADAAMAGNVFEVAYNIVLEKGTKAYGNKGKSKSIMDYRRGLCNGLHVIADRDKKLREEALQAARDRATQAAKAAEPPAARRGPATGNTSECDMHDDDDDDDNWDDGDGGYGAGWRSASSSDDGMPLARRDDVWVSESEHEDGEDDASGHVKQEGSTEEAGEQELQQLVLYDDKAKLAHEAVEEKVKIKKGKKLKQRGVTDWEAYIKGKKDADSIKLGAKTLPAPVAKSAAEQSKTAGASGNSSNNKPCQGAKKSAGAKRSSTGKEQKAPVAVKKEQKSVASVGKGRAVLGSADKDNKRAVKAATATK